MAEKFYAGDYWKTSEGLKLWQVRLLHATITYLNKNINHPFFITTLGHEEHGHLEGYYAEWSTSKHSLTIEVEGQVLCLFGSTATEVKGKKDSTYISAFYGDPTDPDNDSWDELMVGLEKMRLWFEKAYADQPDENKQKYTVESHLFNLTDHLK